MRSVPAPFGQEGLLGQGQKMEEQFAETFAKTGKANIYSNEMVKFQASSECVTFSVSGFRTC